MTYPLDGPVYTLEDRTPNPFEHLETEIELNSADIADIIKEDITDRIEIYPEFAKQITEAERNGMVHALGAMFDAALLLDVDKQKAIDIMNKAIEILKERKLY